MKTNLAIESIGLSHTRITQFEDCPAAYRFRYIERQPAAHIAHLESGIVVHRALELLVRGAIAEGHEGPLATEAARKALRTAWATEKAVGVGAYIRAKAMVERFVETEENFDAGRVLGVEAAFSIPFGPFTLNGVMDRVDRLDDETIEIIDYKTGEMVPTADEVREHLQLPLYQHAAQELWPWAKRIKLTLHMVRHGIKLHTTRTPEEIASAVEYAMAIGERIKRAMAAGDFAPRISARCRGCQFRLSCPAYAKLADAGVGTGAIPADIDAVATEREKLHALAKGADARRQELDELLRATVDTHGELVAAGRRYTIRNTARRTYPLAETVGMVTKATGIDAGTVVERLATVNNGSLAKLLKELENQLPQPQVTLLQAELEAAAERTPRRTQSRTPRTTTRSRRRPLRRSSTGRTSRTGSAAWRMREAFAATSSRGTTLSTATAAYRCSRRTMCTMGARTKPLHGVQR